MTSFIRSRIAVALAIGLILVTTGQALAGTKLTTISFTATVDEVADYFGNLCVDIAPGDVITGTYTFDAKADDSNSDPTVGDYWTNSGPGGITVRVGGQTASSDPDNTQFLVELVNREPTTIFFVATSIAHGHVEPQSSTFPGSLTIRQERH